MQRRKLDLCFLTARPIAHRGYHDGNKSVCENTISAALAAVERGFAIECDVHLATDGIPVVFHDDDMQRLCNLPGDVRMHTSGELAMRSIGGTRDTVPSLPRFLKAIGGRVPVVIELKGRKDDDEGFADAVLESLEGYKGDVALMSFDHWLLKDLMTAGSPYPVGLTAEGMKPETFFAHEEAMHLGLDFISYCVQHLPNPFIAAQRSQGVPVITWTVRDAAMRAHSEAHADQMTFEGFDPDAA